MYIIKRCIYLQILIKNDEVNSNKMDIDNIELSQIYYFIFIANNNNDNRYTLYGLLVCLFLYILNLFVSFKSILLFYIIATFIYFIFLIFELIIFLLM